MEFQIILMVIALSAVVLCGVFFAAYCLNKTARGPRK